MSNLERDNGQSRGVIGASQERVMGGVLPPPIDPETAYLPFQD